MDLRYKCNNMFHVFFLMCQHSCVLSAEPQIQNVNDFSVAVSLLHFCKTYICLFYAYCCQIKKTFLNIFFYIVSVVILFFFKFRANSTIDSSYSYILARAKLHCYFYSKFKFERYLLKLCIIILKILYYQFRNQIS